MKWRARLGPPSVLIAVLLAGGIVLLAAAVYRTGAWLIREQWPPVSSGATEGSGGAFLLSRDTSTGVIGLIHETDQAFWLAIPSAVDETVMLSLNHAWIEERVFEPSILLWSAMRRESTVRFLAGWDKPRPGRRVRIPALPLSDESEQIAALRLLQRHYTTTLPAPLRSSPGLSATVWIRQGVMHNTLRGGLLILCWILGGYGVWRVIRSEMRFARSLRTHCAYCNYSLVGLISARCPECGRVRMPRWR